MLFLFVEERNEFVSFHYWHVIQYRRRDSGEFLCKRIPSDIRIIQIRSMKLYNIILMSIKDETENEFNAISRLKCAPLYADSSLIRPLFESTADNWCAREMWQLKLDTSKLYFRHFFERLRLRISIVHNLLVEPCLDVWFEHSVKFSAKLIAKHSTDVSILLRLAGWAEVFFY